MSVRNVQPAEHNTLPMMPLAEAQAKGLNVAKVATCAVSVIRDGAYIIKGCRKGKHCAVAGFGTARLGSFGPGDSEPGTGGQGPENVPYYHYDIGSSTEVEGFMPCFIFAQTMLDKYDSQRKTGDILEVLGREGKTTITVLETLPSDGNGNKPGSSTHMVEVPKSCAVPCFKGGEGRSVRMEYALKIRENRERTEAAANRTRMSPTVTGPVEGGGEPETDGVENVFEVPAEQVEVPAGVVDDAPVDGLLGGIENTVIPPSGRKVGRPSRG